MAVANAAMLEYSIGTTWDGDAVSHAPIKLILANENNGVQIFIDAPFFNDSPIPPGKEGEPVWKLWDYEVVEVFFLGDDENYLEVEFSPYGCHIALLLKGQSNAVNFCLPLKFAAEISEDRKIWKGIAHIPASYFPKNVSKFNAYAIHGQDEGRTYLSLYPVPKGKFDAPNFHRLDYFHSIAFQGILPGNSEADLGAIWFEIKNPELGCQN